jgi:hypothetical protein
MPSELTAEGIAALKAGKKVQARALLMQATHDDPTDELAWLWLSGAVETDAERRSALERVLALNPANEGARKGLALLPVVPPPNLSPLADIPSALVPQRDAARPQVTPPPTLTAKPRTRERQRQPKKPSRALPIIVLFLAICVCGCAILALLGRPSTASSPSAPVVKHDPLSAWVMCKQFLNDQLKAPGTAEYPTYDPSYIASLGNASYRVQAYVDSDNSFGAHIRTRFTCTVRYTAPDDMWHLDGLKTL